MSTHITVVPGLVTLGHHRRYGWSVGFGPRICRLWFAKQGFIGVSEGAGPFSHYNSVKRRAPRRRVR